MKDLCVLPCAVHMRSTPLVYYLDDKTHIRRSAKFPAKERRRSVALGHTSIMATYSQQAQPHADISLAPYLEEAENAAFPNVLTQSLGVSLKEKVRHFKKAQSA